VTVESITIQNFQTHGRLSIEFDQHVTTIVGASDVGKSAILRALRWVCQNTPQGEAFVKYGEKGTTVKAVVDGHTVTRRRGKGINDYRLDDAGVDKAFGVTVPQHIQSVLRTAPINFQGQHDAAYWFSLSSGEVSRQLNEIVDLGVIDTTLSNLQSEVRKHKQVAQVCQDRLAEAVVEQEGLAWVLEASDYLIRVEEIRKDSDAKIHEHSELDVCLNRALTHIDNQQLLEDRVADLQEAFQYATEARESAETTRDLTYLINEIVEQDQTVDKGVPDFSEIEDIVSKYNAIDVEHRALEKLCGQIIDGHDDLKQKAMTWDQFTTKIVDETDGVCPVCGGELSV